MYTIRTPLKYVIRAWLISANWNVFFIYTMNMCRSHGAGISEISGREYCSHESMINEKPDLSI